MLAIFVDQASAFYRTIRSVVVKGGPSDEAVPWIIGQLGFDDTQIRDLTQSLLEDSALEQAKVPIQFQDVIADMCAGAHFHTKGVNTSVLTHRGTQPGRSTADLLYNICMRRKLKVIQMRLKSKGLIQSFAWSGNSLHTADGSATARCDLTDATFVDDMVIMTSPDRVADIIPPGVAHTTVLFRVRVETSTAAIVEGAGLKHRCPSTSMYVAAELWRARPSERAQPIAA